MIRCFLLIVSWALFVGLASADTPDCESLYPRPVLSGDHRRVIMDNFVVHYTDTGRDGATPAFIAEVVSAMADTWTHHIDDFGWNPPPPDCGEGGDTHFDVYVMELLDENHVGLVTREGIVGDNPLTDAREINAAYSHLAIDNDFSLVDDPIGFMRSTVAHEFTHALQLGYDSNDSFYGIYESTATLMELLTFREDETASRYARLMFQYPDVCIGGLPETERGLLMSRVYAEWMLMDTLVHLTEPAIIPALWSALAQGDGLVTFYDVLLNFGVLPADAVREMAIRNLLLDYDQASRFEGRVRVEANINGSGTVTPRQTGVQPLSVDYLLITAPNLYTFQLTDGYLELFIVGIDQANNRTTVYDLGQRGTVDTRRYDYAYGIILNTRSHDDPLTCLYDDWTLIVSYADEDTPQDQPSRNQWDASRFIPAG